MYKVQNTMTYHIHLPGQPQLLFWCFYDPPWFFPKEQSLHWKSLEEFLRKQRVSLQGTSSIAGYQSLTWFTWKKSTLEKRRLSLWKPSILSRSFPCYSKLWVSGWVSHQMEKVQQKDQGLVPVDLMGSERHLPNTPWTEKTKKTRPYFLLYWMVNRDPCNGLL